MAKVLVGNFKGPKGDTGKTGPAGPQGPQGPQGNPGTVNIADEMCIRDRIWDMISGHV